MKIAFFDSHNFDKTAFLNANDHFKHDIRFVEPRLTESTATMAQGADAVCAFVNDDLNAKTLAVLKSSGVRIIALRCAGYNCVDLKAAKELGIPVVRVPAYSPHAVAEHAVALILTLNRKIHRAHDRVREGNFSLDGLVGQDLYRKTVGVIGTGKIGSVFAEIMSGFGCRIVAFDITQDIALKSKLKLEYISLDELYSTSDIISLHLPLTTTTRHLIDAAAISKMKKGVQIINTGRGGLIDSKALIQALKKGQIGSAGLDVYEEEEALFFKDHSNEVIQDDLLARLLTFPNVLITAHQAFLTEDALHQISETTLRSLSDFENNFPLHHQIEYK